MQDNSSFLDPYFAFPGVKHSLVFFISSFFPHLHEIPLPAIFYMLKPIRASIVSIFSPWKPAPGSLCSPSPD